MFDARHLFLSKIEQGRFLYQVLPISGDLPWLVGSQALSRMAEISSGGQIAAGAQPSSAWWKQEVMVEFVAGLQDQEG